MRQKFVAGNVQGERFILLPFNPDENVHCHNLIGSTHTLDEDVCAKIYIVDFVADGMTNVEVIKSLRKYVSD